MFAYTGSGVSSTSYSSISLIFLLPDLALLSPLPMSPRALSPAPTMGSEQEHSSKPGMVWIWGVGHLGRLHPEQVWGQCPALPLKAPV